MLLHTVCPFSLSVLSYQHNSTSIESSLWGEMSKRNDMFLSTWNNFILESEQGGYIWSTALSVCSAFDPNGTRLVGEILSQGIWWQWIYALIKIWGAWNFVRHLNWGSAGIWIGLPQVLEKSDNQMLATDPSWSSWNHENRNSILGNQKYTHRHSNIVLTKSK